MLIVTERHTARDLEEWERLNKTDRAMGLAHDWERKQAAAMRVIERFKPNYVGCSWGKDSVVVAHLVWAWAGQRGLPLPPLVFVRVLPRYNPDVDLVRDAFLERFPWPNYQEIEVQFRPQSDGTWVKPGGRLTSSAGFEIAAQRFGPRYVSGIRADESNTRRKRVQGGLSTKNTCAPIGHWRTAHVFAYLERFGLPVHPAYGYLGGKRWDRERLRVASLFGDRGTQFGRRDWEMQYYGDVWHELRRRAIDACSGEVVCDTSRGEEVPGPVFDQGDELRTGAGSTD